MVQVHPGPPRKEFGVGDEEKSSGKKRFFMFVLLSAAPVFAPLSQADE